MRRAYLQCRSLPVVALVLIAVAGLSILLLPLITGSPSPALAATEPLSISLDHDLSPSRHLVTITVSGQLPDSLIGAKLSVAVRGPVALADIGQTDAEAHEVAVISHVLGKAATHTGTTGTGSAGTETTLASTTTTTTAASALLRQGTVADLEAGTLEATMTIPAGTPAEPGAYLLEVQVQVGGEVLGERRGVGGQEWPTGTAPLDVAFVLPVSLGIHGIRRELSSTRLWRRRSPRPAPAADWAGLFAAFAHSPQWDFTLAIEPMLLTQLRDMADGYSGVDSSGAQVQVAERRSSGNGGRRDCGGRQGTGRPGARADRGQPLRRSGPQCDRRRRLAGRFRADPDGQAGTPADPGPGRSVHRARTRPISTSPPIASGLLRGCLDRPRGGERQADRLTDRAGRCGHRDRQGE